MRAILLAAGLGTRLRPLTDTMPKCLVPIKGQPLLGIWLERLTQMGIGPFLVNTHYLAEEVEAFIEASPYRDQVTLVNEPKLQGTAGTLIANIDFFQGEDGLLIHADNYCLADFTSFQQAHRNRPPDCLMTMMTFRADNPSSCGIVELDERGVVIGFHEKVAKPPGNLANGAVYILSAELLAMIAKEMHSVTDFSTEVLNRFVGKIYYYETSEVFLDVGTQGNFELANRIPLTLSRNQKIKKGIKAALEGLPGGLGSNVAIPLIKRLLAVFGYRLWFIQLNRKRNAKREAIRIRSLITGGSKHATIFYDNFVSPPTIGDFLNVVMLGRYFLAKNIPVKFYIIDGEYRSDWYMLTLEEIKNFVEFQIDLVKNFIPISEIEVTLINWEDYLKIIQDTTPEAGIVPLQDLVENRVAIYGGCFNLLNFLLAVENNFVLDKFLLKSTDFASYGRKNETMPKNYVSWHVRYNDQWGFGRNLSAEQFKYYLNRVSKLHPGKDIILVSDKKGCDYYKYLVKHTDVNVKFSKDFNNNFYGDCFIILNSSFYHQFRGGGIGMIPIFSSLPYEIVDPCTNEIAWSHPKFTSWANTDQKRYFSTDEI
jgi:mannose-1-phosphate guanylyltransferase